MPNEAQRRQIMLANPQYDPNALFDFLRNKTGAENDRQLCRLLGIQPSEISKTRKKHKGISSELLLHIHDATDMPIKRMKKIMNIS